MGVPSKQRHDDDALGRKNVVADSPGVALFKTIRKLSKIYFIIFLIQCIVIVILIFIPKLQNGFIYANWLTLTFGQSLDDVSLYGPYKSLWKDANHQSVPLFITTKDGEKLGSWYFTSNVTLSDQMELDDDKLLFIYFHGNCGTRSLIYRTMIYNQLLAVYPKASILTTDYRGFGDSTGSPSESGVLLDATAIWDFAIHDLKVKPNNIILIGQSLGSAIVTLLTKYLMSINMKPACIILFAALLSVPDAAASYPYMKLFLPLPMLLLPNSKSYFQRIMTEHFDSLRAIQEGIACPIMWIHGRKDGIVPFSHSMGLVEASLKHFKNSVSTPDELYSIGNNAAVFRSWNDSSISFIDIMEGTHESFGELPFIFQAMKQFIKIHA